MGKSNNHNDLLIVNAVAMQTTGVGDYVYRVEQPSIAMGKIHGIMVVNVSTISPHFTSLCLQADILILHLLAEHDLLPIIEQRKRTNQPTIYEISDNFLAFESEADVMGWFSDPMNIALCFQYADMADALQVTGKGLKEYFGYLNKNVIIFENHLDGIGRSTGTDNETVTIGWGGSAGHANDLKYISNIIIEICGQYPNVIFSYMGNKDPFINLFERIPHHQKVYTSPGTLNDYFGFLEKLDIGIAPLRDTPYNRCRSDVKFLEYASRGIAPVLSALTPYLTHAVNEVNALLFENPEQLKTALERISDILGEKETALKAFQVAADIAPSFAEPQHRLAEYFWVSGDIVRCMTHCVKALEIDNTHAPSLELAQKVSAAAGNQVI